MNANDVIICVFNALDQLQIPFMLVGSYSSNYYGIARATQDADIVIQLERQSISEFRRILGPDFRLDPQMSFETVTGSTYRYNLVHVDSAFKIELFLLSDVIRMISNALHAAVPPPSARGAPSCRRPKMSSFSN